MVCSGQSEGIHAAYIWDKTTKFIKEDQDTAGKHVKMRSFGQRNNVGALRLVCPKESNKGLALKDLAVNTFT